MTDNGSPDPSFESDDSSYVLVTIPARLLENTNQAKVLLFRDLDELIAFTNQATNQAGKKAEEILDEEIHGKVQQIVGYSLEWRKRKEILENIGVTNQTFNRSKYLDPLTSIGWIEQKHPNKDSHPHQAYRLSESGKRLLDLLKRIET